MRRWHMLLAAMLVFGLLAAPSVATATTTTSGHDHEWIDRCNVDFDDEDCAISAAEFLTLAAQSNRFEIATGELAQQRGESTTVRELGALFATEHTAVLGEITTLAGTLGVTIPEGLGPRYQALADRLGTLSGAKFDRVWLKVQWRVHQEALALLLRGAICGDVPEIRALAQATLPAITRHLAELRAVLAAFPSHHGDGDHGDHDHGDDDHGDDDHGKHRGHFQGKGHFHHGNGHGHGHKHHEHA
jgi:predicted outer membrane protein